MAVKEKIEIATLNYGGEKEGLIAGIFSPKSVCRRDRNWSEADRSGLRTKYGVCDLI